MKKKTETKNQAIVDVAAEVFREMGFERASMSEICRRVGGSKATIYNYFPSKEHLFFEVLRQAVEAEFLAVHQALDHETDDLSEALENFGVGLLTLLYSPGLVAARRLVLTHFGDSEHARKFYELGPKRSMKEVMDFLNAAMTKGKLRVCDPLVATLHLRGLLESELLDSFIFQIEKDLSPENIKAIVQRAITAFMAAYGPVLTKH